ncbi:MAG: glycosyl hydrolase, partial [SAR202 cluster bacterium]|nr:glycosyl hydrolase [SAR202 cluster bacterium]
MTIDSLLLDTIEWRQVGPFRGGRVVAVAGDPATPQVFYFGACSGGIWKTSDGGTYWENVSDGFLNTASIGAIAVSNSDTNVIYAGSGEACIRGNVSQGDGVYKSTDSGKTWRNMGLKETRHIGRIRIHPSNSD